MGENHSALAVHDKFDELEEGRLAAGALELLEALDGFFDIGLGVLLALRENSAVLDDGEESRNGGLIFLELEEEGEELAVFF